MSLFSFISATEKSMMMILLTDVCYLRVARCCHHTIQAATQHNTRVCRRIETNYTIVTQVLSFSFQVDIVAVLNSLWWWWRHWRKQGEMVEDWWANSSTMYAGLPACLADCVLVKRRGKRNNSLGSKWCSDAKWNWHGRWGWGESFDPASHVLETDTCLPINV